MENSLFLNPIQVIRYTLNLLSLKVPELTEGRKEG